MALEQTEYSRDFYNGLELFDMKNSSGLIFIEDKNNPEIIISPFERLALETAEKYQATAVYFRKFPNAERPSIPQVYIYDFTQTDKNIKEIVNLHKALWNSAQIPLFFVFQRTEVQIFNCLKPPDINNETGEILCTILEKIQLASEIDKQIEDRNKLFYEFSAKKFDNGTFWDSSGHKEEFKLNDTVYERLLIELKNVKEDILAKKILPKGLTQRLLVMIILIKYLEERKDDDGKTVFSKTFFNGFVSGATSFSEVLREKGACLRLFDYLSTHFNGKIFELCNEEDRETINKVDLSSFADFLEGRISGRQYTLWRLYSFNHLPIELISNIYEDFLTGKTGIVYTPPFLVNFLLDECMPVTELKTNFKVLDPACGSGIFLVAAYRRIVNRWRVLNNWRKPNLTTLKQLLRDNIYGVDKSNEAVLLTAFSLSLAICDMLSPKEIWEELKFDNLFNKNLFGEDFFKLVEEKVLTVKFDLVIGNPPFISNLITDTAKRIENKRQNERPQIPDNQIALLFLDQSINFCKENCLLCLILPAGPFLYNNTSFSYRKWFIENYNIYQIIDFAALNGILFESADVSVVAVFAKKERPKNKELLHITVRRTKASKEHLFFELDHYDFYHVNYQEALTNKLIWKINLLGGGRLKYIINRFSEFRNLGMYLREKRQKDGWKFGEGFKIGNRQQIERFVFLTKQDSLSIGETKELMELKKQFKKADYLTGRNTLPSEAFTEKGIDNKRIHILKEKYFTRNVYENRAIFQNPHLLVKEGAKELSIPIEFRNDYLTFKHRIIGIYAPEKQVQELLEIEKRIKNNNTCLFLVACLSGSYMINRATAVLEKDIFNLPYPKEEKDMVLSDIEEILVDDILNYFVEFHKKGENSRIIKKAGQDDLKKFGDLYCKILNTVYKDLKPHVPIELESFICYPFYFKEEPKISLNKNDIELYLNQLIIKNFESANLRITRVLRIFDQNIIYLVKPKELRFWLQSIAIRDADETFTELIKQGY